MVLINTSAGIFEQEAILIIHEQEDAVQLIANASFKGTKTSWALGCKWVFKEIEQEFYD